MNIEQENAELREKLAKANAVIVCGFCGHETDRTKYGWLDDVAGHIAACKRHPMNVILEASGALMESLRTTFALPDSATAQDVIDAAKEIVAALAESGCKACQSKWKTGEPHYVCARCRVLERLGKATT